VENHQKIEIPIVDIIQLITILASPDRSVIVGVDGGAGSGKTTFTHWFAEAIKESVNQVVIVHMDNLCVPIADRRKKYAEVSDLDWRRLRDQVLIPLRNGKSARFQLYDWPEDRLRDWMLIDVGGVLLIDGVTATRRELSSYYDIRIWFSCPQDIRVSRLSGRGDTSAEEIKHWIPSEESYIASHNSVKRAHLVIDSSADNKISEGSGWFTKSWSPSIHASYR